MNFSKKRPVKIVMLGAGGTGAHIAPHLYRLLYALERPVKFIICDGDKVEPKNLVRQNFTEADLGENKARVIAERYSDVFGLETSYIPRFIEDAGQLEELLRPEVFRHYVYGSEPNTGRWVTNSELVILIGAVDNNKSRKLCHEVFLRARDLVYIDSGNGEYTGQIVCGIRRAGKTVYKPVGMLYPEVSTPEDLFPTEVSCAEASVSAPQTIVANLMAATAVVTMIYNILVIGCNTVGYHLTIGSGRMRKIMDENIESIEKFIAHQFPDFVASLVAPLALVILLLAIDWRYGIVSLFGIILAFVVQFLGFNGSAKEKMHHYQTAQEDMNNASVEYVRGMPEIKAFNQTADSFRRLSKSITDYTSFVLEYAMGWQNCMPGFTTIIHNIYLLLIPVGIFIGMGAEDYRTYSLTFIFYLVLAPAISGVLNKIMYISESFTQIDGNVERMEEVLSIPVLQNQDVGAREQGHSIEFDHVSFSYDTGTSVKALNDVSFIARQGEVTAIVGPSGGGKSTIANLISRFWDVTEGCIRIGGVDIRKIPQAELMRQVSFVFQDTFLFKQSILDNIRMGNPTASEAQVIEAAKAAQCHDFIEKLPDGYHTMIGASGIRLSGGERQRIAIARAIIKDAPIIVLDEATAFSDPENEYLIQKAFEKLIQNKTVIMIAHRLSTIRNADQILVMEHGQLIEQGTHDTLMERQGKYTQMWNSYMESISWKIRAGKGGAIE